MKTLTSAEGLEIRALMARVQRRLWLRHLLDHFQGWAPLQIGALGVWVLFVGLGKSSVSVPASTRWLVLGGIFFLPVAVTAACEMRRKGAQYALSLWVDRQIGSDDLLTSALCFARRDPTTSVERWVIQRARERVAAIDPRQLVKIRATPRLVLSVTCFLGLGILLHGIGHAQDRPPTQRRPSQLQTGPRDAEGAENLREALGDLAFDTPEAQKELAGLRRLMDQALASGRSDSAELDWELSRARGRLQTAGVMPFGNVSAMGRALGKHPATAELAQALTLERLADAAAALEALQKRWADVRTRPTPEELRSLRKAVEEERRARTQGEADARAEAARLTAERQELLAKRQQPGLGPTEQQRMEAIERRLSYLEREKKPVERASSALSALDRALLEAARDLERQLQPHFEDFSRAKAELETLDRFQRSEAEKQRLLEKILELQRRLRQKGQSEATRDAALLRFGRRAEGSAGPEVGGRPVEAQPDPSASTVLLQSVPVAVGVAPLGASSLSSRGEPGTGDRHESTLRGKPDAPALRPPGSSRAAAAKDTGAGTVSADVVAAAASRGFVSRDYREVYRAYLPVVEARLAEQEVPRSNQEQVRRYFRLIAPRSAGNGAPSEDLLRR